MAKKGTGVAAGTGVVAGIGAWMTHPIANANARKAITLWNWITIVGYYTQAVTIEDVRECNPG
jgi:hypothetical protein